MKTRHSLMLISLPLLGILGVALPVAAEYPFATGSANAPITVSSGASFSYNITGWDKDYDSNGDLWGDFMILSPDSPASMDPETVTITGGSILDGNGNPTGDALWTISGRALTVTERTVVVDSLGVGDSTSTEPGVATEQIVEIIP